MTLNGLARQQARFDEAASQALIYACHRVEERVMLGGLVVWIHRTYLPQEDLSLIQRTTLVELHFNVLIQ
jgi:hypothetical protein